MRIIPLTSVHYPKVALIYQQGIDLGDCTFETKVPTWEEFDGNHLCCCRFVALNEQDEMMGWVALSPTSSRYCFRGVAEVSIYLDQRYRGQGIGKKMLHHVIVESEKNGIWSLISGIFPENISRLKLHESCGFKQVAYRQKMGETVEGIFRDVLFMEKRSEKSEFN